LLERRLREFVDREQEMTVFTRVLSRRDKTVVVVCGDSGMGKSSLLARMAHECSLRGLRKVEVFCSDTRPYDYVNVMRKIRDDVDARSFPGFNDLVNYYTSKSYELRIKVEGGSIQVAQGATIRDASTGDIAGIIVKDLMLNAPRTDMAVPREEQMMRLTDRFKEELRGVVAKEPMVVAFFDAVEKMSTETSQWLWGELLKSVRDQEIPNVIAVVCGQRRPSLDRDWTLGAEFLDLRPVGEEHIIEYMQKRGIPGEREELRMGAKVLNLSTGGRLAQIADLVDSLLAQAANTPA
jgi:hypothetical protein